MTWRIDGPQGNESAKVKYEIVPYTRGRGLDLGCGHWKTYPHFIGVDNGHHWGQAAADVMCDCDRLDIFATGSLDFVFSSHLIEHIEDYQAALREWWRVIKPGGHLVLYVPHKNFYPNCGEKGANPDHKHDFLPADITAAMPDGFDLIINEERNGGDEYSFLQVFRKVGEGREESWKEPKPAKTCAVIRYGGFGDMLQAASILPGLKEQGYHIDFWTTPRGAEIIRTDPHVDRLFIQDTDQVPNGELYAFWEVLKTKYTKFVNLSESVEGTFLALPGRAAHLWPHKVRAKYLDINYMEFAHELAGVPLPPCPKFHPTEEEREWALKQRAAIPGKVVLYALAGSSVHKIWPYQDNLIARLMLHDPALHVVTVGDTTASILEEGWEKEPRVIRTAGRWGIRQTLAFAELVDVVIGPETGVLNSVSGSDVPKIVFLSHSSKENLTKYWKNTVALEPRGCSCYPCHTLHYGWDHCHREDETGCAKCATKIGLDDAWQAFLLATKDSTWHEAAQQTLA